eukprot:jgi/Ulvmu1/3287/UM152_0010.1
MTEVLRAASREAAPSTGTVAPAPSTSGLRHVTQAVGNLQVAGDTAPTYAQAAAPAPAPAAQHVNLTMQQLQMVLSAVYQQGAAQSQATVAGAFQASAQ